MSENLIHASCLCFDFREDILFRAWILQNNKKKLWFTIPYRKIRKKKSRLFSIYKSIKENGQGEPVYIKKVSGILYPVNGAARIASCIALDKNILFEFFPGDWDPSKVYDSAYSLRPREYMIKKRQGLFKHITDDTISEFGRWLSNWKNPILDKLFIATVWPFAKDNIKGIEKIIGKYAEIIEIKKYTFPISWNMMLSIVYADDRIKDWKYSDKIQVLKNQPKYLYLIYTRVKNPCYRIHKKGHQISTIIEKIKKKVRSEYGSKKIADQNPIHIPDNQEHSLNYEKSLKLLDLDISDFLDSIKGLSYILTKTEVPYMNSDFPESYPVGKDMDIVVLPEHFEKLKQKILKFSKSYPFEIKIIKDDRNFRLRFLDNGNLHYQIDLSILSENFILKSIQERVLVKNYYIAKLKYEIIYRLFYYNQKQKPWHLDYIREYKNSADMNLIKEAGYLKIFKEITNEA